MLAKQATDESLFYVVMDHLGTPREVFSQAGDLVRAAEYWTGGAVRRLWVAVADNDNSRGQREGSFPGGGRAYGALALKDDLGSVVA